MLLWFLSRGSHIPEGWQAAKLLSASASEAISSPCHVMIFNRGQACSGTGLGPASPAAVSALDEDPTAGLTDFLGLRAEVGDGGSWRPSTLCGAPWPCAGESGGFCGAAASASEGDLMRSSGRWAGPQEDGLGAACWGTAVESAASAPRVSADAAGRVACPAAVAADIPASCWLCGGLDGVEAALLAALSWVTEGLSDVILLGWFRRELRVCILVSELPVAAGAAAASPWCSPCQADPA